MRQQTKIKKEFVVPRHIVSSVVVVEPIMDMGKTVSTHVKEIQEAMVEVKSRKLAQVITKDATHRPCDGREITSTIVSSSLSETPSKVLTSC
jgi:hypoxanthine phosphoribosyltransferase